MLHIPNYSFEGSRRVATTRPWNPSCAAEGTLKAVPHSGHSHFSRDPQPQKTRSTWEAKAGVIPLWLQSVRGKERPQVAGNGDLTPPALPTVLLAEFGWDFCLLKVSSFPVESVGQVSTAEESRTQ